MMKINDLTREHLRALLEDGHTQESAALSLGVSREQLRRAARRLGVRFDNRSHRHRYERMTYFRGRDRTLLEIAHMTGIAAETIYHRWWRGIRGEDLGKTTARKGQPRRKFG